MEPNIETTTIGAAIDTNPPKTAPGLFNRNFSLLFSGQTVSVIGTSIYQVILILYLKKITGSGTVMGLVQMLALLPVIIFSPFAGTLADRLNRKKIIIFSDLTRGILMLLLAFFGLKIVQEIGKVDFGIFRLDFAQFRIEVWMIFGATLLVGLLDSLFNPAIAAIIPDIVTTENIKPANGLQQTALHLSELLGSATAGVLFTMLGAPLIIFCNGVSFLVAAISQTFMKIGEQKLEGKEEKGWKPFLRSTRDGLTFITTSKGLRNLFLVSMAVNLLLPCLYISLPFVIEDTMKLAPSFFGYLLATIAIGSVIGYLSYGSIKTNGKIDYLVYFSGFLILAACCILFSFKTTVSILFGAAILAGIAMAVLNLLVQTLLQKIIPEEKRGRVFGTILSIAGILAPVSYGLSGFLIDLLHKDVAKLLLGAAALLFLVFIFIILNKPIHRLIADETI